MAGTTRSAGADAVMVGGPDDTMIAAEVAGIPRHLLYVERAARNRELPGCRREQIATFGVPLDRQLCPPLKLPHLSDVQFGLPGFLKNRLRNQFSSRPEVLPDKCELCGVCVRSCPPGAIRTR